MEDGSEDAEAAAIGEGWARTLRELTLREGRSRRSEVVGTLPAGEEIFIASLIGMRAQVTSPRTGWISTSWEKQATVEALEVERTSPETNDDALSLADLPPIGPGWARTLVEANVREGRAKRSELRGALPAGSRVLIAEVRGPRAQLSQPYEGWISVVTAQQEPVLVQEEGPARKRSSSSEDAAKAPGAKAAALPPAKAKAPAQATPAAAPAKEAPKEPSSSSDSGSGSSDSSSDAARKPQASGALAMGAQVPPLPPGGPPEDEPPEDESSWRARGLGWWWTHQKAVVCKGESRLSEVLGAIPAGQTVFVQEIRAERAFIREPLQGWIPMASPRGHAILAAEAPATFPEPANAPEVEPEEAGRKLAEVELEEATPKALPGSLLLKKRQERRSEHEEKREAQALEQAEHGEEAAPRQETNAMLALRHSGRASAGVPGTLQRRPLVSLERSASARVQFSERPEPGKLQRRSERPAARVSEAEVQKDPAKAQEQTEATLIPGKLSAKLQERKAKTEQERREAEVAEARRREEARQLAEAAEAAEVAEAAEARKREARQREARQLAEAAEVAEVAEARRMEEATQLAEAADAAEVVEARRREEDRQQTEASEARRREEARQQTEASEARRREEATQLAEAAEAAEVVEARRREEESEARRREEAKQLAEAADAAEVVEARRREEDRHQTEASEARRREEARQQSEASEARTREEATQLAEAADAAEVVEARRMEELEEQRRLAELAVVEKEEERQRAKAAEIRSDEERWSEQALAEDKLPAAQKQPGAAGNAQQETLESVLLLQGSPASTREDGLQGAETVGCAPGVSELPPALEHPKPMQEEELAVKTSMPASWQSEPSPSPSRERSRALSTGDLVHHAQPRGEATEAIATLEAMMLRVLHGPVPSFDPEPERRAPRAVGGAGSLAGRERGAKAGMPTFTRQPASRPAPRNQLEAPKPPEVEEEPLNEWWAIEKAESQRRLRALEARLEAAEAQAQEDPMLLLGMGSMEGSPVSGGALSFDSPKALELSGADDVQHMEEAATLLLKHAAAEEWSRRPGEAVAGQMLPAAACGAAPVRSQQATVSRAAPLSSGMELSDNLLPVDPEPQEKSPAATPQGGPIPSWVYEGSASPPGRDIARPPVTAAGSCGNASRSAPAVGRGTLAVGHGAGAAAPLPMDELQHLLTMQEQQLQRQVQLQEQQCQLQEMQLRQQEQQLHLRQQEEQQKQRAQEMREQLRFMEEQQRQLQQRPPAPVPAPTPLLAAPGQLPLQEQQHQQDLLSHILLLHQSSHLQQLRQVQSEQERQLRELQQLQQPWLSPSSRGNRRPAPSPGLREAEAFVSSVRRRAPTRSSATEQDLTRRHADASPRQADASPRQADASPRQADASPREAAAGDVAPAPQSPEPDPWQGRWRQHQQQPPSEFMASETSRSPRSKAPTSVASPAPSRGSVRLQQDKEAIERRLRELEGD